MKQRRYFASTVLGVALALSSAAAPADTSPTPTTVPGTVDASIARPHAKGTPKPVSRTFVCLVEWR